MFGPIMYIGSRIRLVGLSLSSDDEAGGHSCTPLRTPPSDEDSPVVSANGVLRRRLDLSDDRHPPSTEREAEYAACEGNVSALVFHSAARGAAGYPAHFSTWNQFFF